MMTPKTPEKNVFIVYPSEPPSIGHAIDVAVNQSEHHKCDFNVATWKQLDIAGRFLTEGILSKIDQSSLVVADITRLNFNVTFEVGYAIGRGIRVIPTINRSISPPKREISELGIFDTLGYLEYANATEFMSIICDATVGDPLRSHIKDIDRSAPIYLVDTLHDTDASIRIKSKIKKSRIKFRSFDPKEQPRLLTLEAFNAVASSVAVVVHLLPSTSSDYLYNNLRGAFVAGIGYGLGKSVLILQGGDEPIPLDYRDFASIYKHPHDVDPHINTLAPRIIDALQSDVRIESPSDQTLLEAIDLGSPAAENEAASLRAYYLPTEAYNQAFNGMARLAVGRKGSGKTAMFYRLRDKVRSDRRNIVLDLKPDGHQLKRFKYLLKMFDEAVQEHLAKAFWDYVLLLEIAYKILEKDRVTHSRDPELMQVYQELAEVYLNEFITMDVDFSERMLELVQRISKDFEDKYGGNNTSKHLSASEVTGLIYRHDIPRLRRILSRYLECKGVVWVLVDNLDKGWPTHGVEILDITMLRAILDATRQLERAFGKSQIEIRTTVFIRNDVYELLVDNSPDRGKESRVSLDWTDPEALRELLRRRLTVHLQDSNVKFMDIWPQVCVSHIDGEESSEYIISRSLMRPRNLVALMSYCKSQAVNLQHPKIEEPDVRQACASYSADLANEIGLEIRDVHPKAEDLLYYFIDAKPWLYLKEVKSLLSTNHTGDDLETLVGLLMWFSFLGVVRLVDEEPREVYIYDVFYDMKKLRTLAGGLKVDDQTLCIHRAFHPFLEIQS